MDFDNIILRCNNCHFLSLLDFFILNKICFVKYICPNNHFGSLELEKFIENSINVDLNKSMCLVCDKSQENSSIDFNYCSLCKKFICYKCLKKHNEHTNYCQIILSKFDGFCSKHLKCYLYFCKICKLNLCIECKKDHGNSSGEGKLLHDILNISSNYILSPQDEEKIYNIIENLNKIKLNELIEEKIKTIIEYSIKFMNLLLSTLKYEISKNNLNFYPVQNILNFKKKLEQLNIFLDNKIKSNSYDFENINYIFTNKIEKCILSLSTYPDKIYHLMILKDGRLASSTKEGIILIYSSKNFNIEVIIHEHKSSIFYFTQLENNYIITCSLDKEVKIIKLIENSKYEIIQTIKEFDGAVTKILEFENKLISLSNDKYMRIFLFYENEKVFKLDKKIQFSKISSYSDGILVNNNKELITILSEEKSLKFWDLKNYSNINTFSTIDTTYPCGICLLNSKILCVGGSNFKGFFLIDISTHEILKNIKGMNYIYCIFRCFDNSFIAAVNDSQKINSLIKYKFDEKSVDLIEIYKKENAHNNIITTICELEDGEIVTAGKDEYLKIWI